MPNEKSLKYCVLLAYYFDSFVSLSRDWNELVKIFTTQC